MPMVTNGDEARKCCGSTDFSDLESIPDKCQGCRYVAYARAKIPTPGWQYTSRPASAYRVLVSGTVVERATPGWTD